MNTHPNSYLLGFSELILYIFLFISSTPLLAGYQSKYGLNLYSLFLLFGSLIKFIPEFIIKRLGKLVGEKLMPNSNFFKLWERPENAKFCGMVGPFGKESADTPGMPSGHSTVIAYIVTILLFNMVEMRKENKMNFSYVFIIFIILLGILVPLSRVELGCHTYPQIITGCVLGFIIGFSMYMIDKLWLRKYEAFSKDREEFYKMLSA